MCEQGCEGMPAKINMWMKLHYKAAHGLKFEGMDFHKPVKVKRRHAYGPTKDDIIESFLITDRLKTVTETLDHIQTKNSGFK
jgi:hypothetical protein